MEKREYLFNAKVTRVIDGDTVVVDVDLGFFVTLRDQTLRLAKVNAPELKGKTAEEGAKSKEALRQLVEGKDVVLRTYKSGNDKYGRILAEVFVGDKNVNDWLVTEGLAKPFMV